MRNWRYWHRPGYWRWWWNERARFEFKATVITLLVIALATSGYYAATSLETEPAASYVVTTTRVVTIKRKNLPPQVVTLRETRTLPVRTTTDTQMITVRQNGKTIVLPAETVTTKILGPVRNKVVTKTKLQTRTVPGKRVVITLPGVTLPGTTVPGPERVVTLPERVVTTTAPTDTVVITQTGPTQTVTSPAQTVTHSTTTTLPAVTVTNQVTVTDTVTVTQTETVTVTEPPPNP